MPKKRASPEVRGAILRDLEAIVARLNHLDAVLNQIEARLEPLLVLPQALEANRQLALEAVAQAQDAMATGQLARLHEDRLNSITLAVAEGIQHVERAEARIRATVGRARAELRAHGIESPGIEAEAGTLRLGNGAGSDDGGVPTVREVVGTPVTPYDDRTPSPVPGMTLGELRRFRGA